MIDFIVIIFFIIIIIITKQKEKSNYPANSTKVIKSNKTVSKITPSFIIEEQEHILKDIYILKTNELLEILIPLNRSYEYINQIHSKITQNGKILSEDYLRAETKFYNIIENLIDERINIKIIQCRNDIEKIISLKEELIYCKKRFPNFEKYINSNLLKIESIEDIQNEQMNKNNKRFIN